MTYFLIGQPSSHWNLMWQRSLRSPSCFFYKDTSPNLEGSTLMTSFNSSHLPKIPPPNTRTIKVRISTYKFQEQRAETFSPLQMGCDKINYETKKEEHMRPKKKAFKLVWEFYTGVYKSSIYAGRCSWVVGNVRSESLSLPFLCKEIQKGYIRQGSTEAKMLILVLPWTSSVNFYT